MVSAGPFQGCGYGPRRSGTVQPSQSLRLSEIRPAAFGGLLPDLPAPVLTFFSTMPFSQPAAWLQNSGSNRCGRTWRKRALMVRSLPCPTFVDGGLHVVVMPRWESAEGGEGPGMGVEEHFMALADRPRPRRRGWRRA